MKALLIDPADKTIENIEIADRADIASLVGFDTIINDPIDDDGNQLFFDEECFLRGDQVKGRFQLSTMIPVSGKAVIISANADGSSLADVTLSADQLRERVTFL